MNTITYQTLPPRADQRIQAYQGKLARRGDYHYLVHASRVAAGVRWQEQFRHRPIPRHRALVAA